jgi:class 3 adenylate cyclase
MNKLMANIHHYFIPDSYWEDEHYLRKARVLINTLLVTIVFSLVYIGNCYLVKMPIVGSQITIYLSFYLLILLLFKNKVSLIVCCNLFCTAFVTSTIFDSYFTGGIDSATLPWFGITPILAIIIMNRQMARIWLIIVSVCIIIFGLLKIYHVELPIEAPEEYRALLSLNSQLGLPIILFVITSVMEKAYLIALDRLDEKNKIIAKEKKRSDDLILNILPAEVVAELKDEGHSKAKLFDDVTVLFTDFVNFTSITEFMDPEVLVNEIDTYFKAFDEISERNKLEKIKTIGDAYLAVCGLPIDDENHAINVMKAATEILEFTKQQKLKGGMFNIRIGIHSGSLIAGVVGVKKFAYDIWGDTVNTASRMEQASEPGQINISESTYELVKDYYEVENRGSLEVKNKGLLQMYFLKGLKSVK